MKLNITNLKFITVFAVVLIMTSFSYKKKLLSGTLIYKDGTKVEGLISPFMGLDNIIKFRKDENSKDEKIKTSLLKYIYIKNDKEKFIDTLHVLKVAYASSKIKITEDEFLATRIYQSASIEGFIVFYSDVDRYISWGTQIFNNNYDFYVKQPNDDYMVYLTGIIPGSIAIAGNKIMRSNFKQVINGKCPKMDKQIDDKKYTSKEFVDMLKDYTEICK